MSTKQLGKTIRCAQSPFVPYVCGPRLTRSLDRLISRCLEQGDVDSALLAFLSHSKASGAVADAALCAALLLGCVRGSRLSDASSACPKAPRIHVCTC